MQDVTVGDPQFDNAFVMKSTVGNAQEAAHVKQLLADPELRRLLVQQRDVSLSVVDDEGLFGPHFEENVDELFFQVSETIRDIDRLKGLFDLFATTLHRLCVIGSAYETDPNDPGPIPAADSLLRPSGAPPSDDLLRPAEGSAASGSDHLLRPGEWPATPAE